jgi:hypothetical protein
MYYDVVSLLIRSEISGPRIAETSATMAVISAARAWCRAFGSTTDRLPAEDPPPCAPSEDVADEWTGGVLPWSDLGGNVDVG